MGLDLSPSIARTTSSHSQERSTAMIDRTELDLRMASRARLTNAINGRGWAQAAVLPMPAPRATLAALLRRLAARLDPAQANRAAAPGPLAGPGRA
jgi:hypothetical protein